uniref:Immunoglobulin V-set domain-containing protein n=1 Tax=Oryzias latipes TaxID=8090 RepID=A0A3P9JTE3_ORYLA
MRNFCRISLLSSLRVQQTPAEMHRLPGSSANLSCSHSIPSYDRILWYRQQGDGMQLLGYMNVMKSKADDEQNSQPEGWTASGCRGLSGPLAATSWFSAVRTLVGVMLPWRRSSCLKRQSLR